MKVGLLCSALPGKQLRCTLSSLNLDMKERRYFGEMVGVGKKMLLWTWRPWEACVDTKQCFWWLPAFSLEAGILQRKISQCWALLSKHEISSLISCLTGHSIVSGNMTFFQVFTVPSMRGNFLGDTWALRRQEVEQPVTNNKSEMPAFERALLSLHRAL